MNPNQPIPYWITGSAPAFYLACEFNRIGPYATREEIERQAFRIGILLKEPTNAR